MLATLCSTRPGLEHVPLSLGQHFLSGRGVVHASLCSMQCQPGDRVSLPTRPKGCPNHMGLTHWRAGQLASGAGCCVARCSFAPSDLGLIICQMVGTVTSSSGEGEGWASLGSREEVDPLLSTGGQAPWGGARLGVWRPHHVAATSLPKPGPCAWVHSAPCWQALSEAPRGQPEPHNLSL